MAPIIPTEVPSVITAGETVQFTRAFQGFPPADGWIYSFHMNGPSDVLHKNAETGSDPFLVTLTSTETSFTVTDPKGTSFQYEEWIQNADATEKYQMARGPITVLMNLQTAPPGATQSHAQKMVALIEAEIQRRVTDDVQSYQIGAGTGSRALVKIPIKELQSMLGIYRAQVNAQSNPNSLGTQVKVMFPNEETGHDYPATWVDVTGVNR